MTGTTRRAATDQDEAVQDQAGDRPQAPRELGISEARRWLNVGILVVSVACLPFAAGLYLLALVTGPLRVDETCPRLLHEPMVRFDEDLFPLVRKTCIGQTRQVQVVSPTVALPAAVTLTVGLSGVLYLRQVGRHRQRW